jgi:hypothetical protein
MRCEVKNLMFFSHQHHMDFMMQLPFFSKVSTSQSISQHVYSEDLLDLATDLEQSCRRIIVLTFSFEISWNPLKSFSMAVPSKREVHPHAAFDFKHRGALGRCLEGSTPLPQANLGCQWTHWLGQFQFETVHFWEVISILTHNHLGFSEMGP